MKKAALKLLPYGFWLGIAVAVGGLLWLALYYTTHPGEAAPLILAVLACIAVQVAAYIGGRRFPRARFWPAACMLACAPATVWCALAGPRAVYGVDASLFDFNTLAAAPPLVLVTLPVILGGLLGCIVWALAGIFALFGDIVSLANPRGPAAGKAPPPPDGPAAGGA
jgi:hypothetical protein